VEIKTFNSKELAGDGAIEKLNSALESSAEKHVLLLLSGGSALELIDRVDPSHLSSKTTISVLDERYSEDPEENNFAQVTNTLFYKNAQEKGCKFIDTRIQNGESQEELAKRFNISLTSWFKKNPNGMFIATMGMGPDGHTSGMIPYPEDNETFAKLFDNGSIDDFVTFYNAAGRNPYPLRVTTNMSLLRKIDYAIVYITGENKRDAFARLKLDEGTLGETPARILREIKGDVCVFTDIE